MQGLACVVGFGQCNAGGVDNEEAEGNVEGKQAGEGGVEARMPGEGKRNKKEDADGTKAFSVNDTPGQGTACSSFCWRSLCEVFASNFGTEVPHFTAHLFPFCTARRPPSLPPSFPPALPALLS